MLKLLILSVLFLLVGCPRQTQELDQNITLGNPSNATNNPANGDNYLMIKPQYALSYNKSNGTANWVSWQLNRSWFGVMDRQNDFRADPTLPADWDQVTPNDYTNSGYDRGHLTPSADRTRNKEDNSATFLMVNILPQVPELNRGVWSELENYARSLVLQESKELYIIAGPTGKVKSIGKSQVAVPQYNWKIIVVLDQPGRGVQGVTEKTRTIAVKIPNSRTVRGTDWRQYRVSIDSLERETGYDFLSAVPSSIQDKIEKEIDRQ